MPDSVRVKKDEAGLWRWTRWSEGNNKRIAVSGESFDSKANALRAAEREAGEDANVVVEEQD